MSPSTSNTALFAIFIRFCPVHWIAGGSLWLVVAAAAASLNAQVPLPTIAAEPLSPNREQPGQNEEVRVDVDATIAQANFNGETVTAPPDTSTGELTKEAIAQELKAVETATELSDEARAEIKERLGKATGWLEAEAKSHKRQEEIEIDLPQTPVRLKEARERLATFSDVPFQLLPSGKTVAELEGQLTSLRGQVEADEKQLRDREKEIEGRTTRLTSLAKEAAELEQRITQLGPQIASIKPTDYATRSQSLELRARLRLHLQELATTRLERRRLEEQAELLPLQRDLAKRTWTNRQKMLTRWEASIDRWRKEESKRQAEEARRIVADSHPALKSLAEENALIAENRMATAAEIQKLTDTIKKLSQLKSHLEEDFSELHDRVEHAGTTSTTGLLLRKKRGELPNPGEFAARAAHVQSTMPDAHLQLLNWKRQRREVADPEEVVNKLLESLDQSLARFDRTQVTNVLQRLMTDRRELLDKAIPDQDTYLQDLNELELVNQQLSEKVAEFREYLNQRILWIRSTDVISAAELRAARGELTSILQPQRWRETAKTGGGEMLQRPVIAIGLLACVILLVIFRTRLHAMQIRLTEPLLDGGPAGVAQSLGAFAIAVLLSARWPAVLLAIGYRLRVAADSSSFSVGVGNALITSVAFFWSCELIREICRRDAVGHRVFGWPEMATASVRATLGMTILIGTPLFALLQLAQFGEIGEMQSLQRVVFITLLAFFGIQLAQLTRPHGALMRGLREISPDSLVVRGRHLIWLCVSGAPFAFVILSSIGYHFSAYQLSSHLAESAGAVVAIILFYSLALAWLKIAGHQREAARAATVDNASPNIQSTLIDGGTASFEINEAPTNESDDGAAEMLVDREIRDLLRYACLLLLIIGAWFIWSEVLPALRILDRVVLWHNIEPVAESFVDSEGNESLRMVEDAVPTTLTDTLVAILICCATLVVGRRMPGVLEFLLRERLPVEPGGRHAIGIIARYVVTFAGILLACSVIRLSWSSVQWLAAAMTVGLGFGLQEIFANLVSGLIVLVERPIRVGDTVSVGDVTGTVSKMQMRATTITDYDRRELIVPNKKFITDNVVNWTLSDPISRVVLPVGVAYGTDVSTVRQILLRIARRCPYVLDDPEPNTLFKSFGDSTLNVQLMVFIPQRSVYVEVVNELNGAIAREFAAKDIQIAFPQLDLHIKTGKLDQVALDGESDLAAA